MNTFIPQCPKCSEGKLIVGPQRHDQMSNNQIRIPSNFTILYCENCQWKGGILDVTYKRL